MFDTTDDQGWCDIGYETCEKIALSYEDNDWCEFLNSLERLNDGVYLGVLEIMPLAPSRIHPNIIESLLEHAKGEAWLEAFSEFSMVLQDSPEVADDILSRVSVLKKFEAQFIVWVNFKVNENEDFCSYYRRYSHLIDQQSRECYESLRILHNKQMKREI